MRARRGPSRCGGSAASPTARGSTGGGGAAADAIIGTAPDIIMGGPHDMHPGAAKLRAGRGLRLPKAKGTGNAESPEAWTLALRAMTDHAALFGATPTSKCPKTLDTDEAALEALPSALAAVEQTRLDVAQAFLSVAFCVEINQCVGCTR